MEECMSSDHRLIIQEALLLLQEETTLLASLEDAAYFRSFAKQAPKRVREEPLPQEIPISPPVLQKEKEEPVSLPPSPPPPSLVVEKEVLGWRSEPNLKSESLPFASLKPLFQKAFPNVILVDDIPSDTMAKKIANRWKTKNQVAPISILFLSEPPKQRDLLCEIAKAIDVSFGSARLIDAEAIEKEKQWETFLASEEIQLVIVCDYTLWQLHDLLRHYKETPAQQMRTLGKVPLLLLPDLSLYLKDPLLKRSLWKAICKRLS